LSSALSRTPSASSPLRSAGESELRSRKSRFIWRMRRESFRNWQALECIFDNRKPGVGFLAREVQRRQQPQHIARSTVDEQPLLDAFLDDGTHVVLEHHADNHSKPPNFDDSIARARKFAEPLQHIAADVR